MLAESNRDIVTKDGLTIPWFEKKADNYLDKTTLIFGGTGSGKTRIIEEILYICKDYIPNYIVLAPRTSDSAYREKLSARCIKEDLTKEKFELIWQRQVHLTQIYNIANNINVLRELFNKINNRTLTIAVQAIMARATEFTNLINRHPHFDFAQKKAQKTLVKEHTDRKLLKMFKNAIRKHKDQLTLLPLSVDERIALEYLDMNPRLMMVIDDCSEKIKIWMKYWKKRDRDNPFEGIFFKGRHNFITLVFAAHDDKYVETEFRKNARTTIYTTSQALSTAIGKQGSGFTPAEKKEALKMAASVFHEEIQGVKTYKKLCYVREDTMPFKYTIATVYDDFTIGSQPLQELASKMPKRDDGIIENPFVKKIIR